MTGSILVGGMPSAWQYAEARRFCRFTRLRQPRGPRGITQRTATGWDECGLCGRRWEVAWIGVDHRQVEAEAPSIWLAIYEHCVDHVNRMADE